MEEELVVYSVESEHKGLLPSVVIGLVIADFASDNGLCTHLKSRFLSGTKDNQANSAVWV